MSKLIREEEYLRLIIYYLKNDSKIYEIENDEGLKEIDLDISSNELYKSLYNNLLFYYKNFGKKNIESEKQKYF